MSRSEDGAAMLETATMEPPPRPRSWRGPTGAHGQPRTFRLVSMTRRQAFGILVSSRPDAPMPGTGESRGRSTTSDEV